VAASKRWLAIALALVAIAASLEYVPRDLLFRVAVPDDAAFPLNEGPLGTSELWNRLSQAGYGTAIVYGTSGVAAATADARDVVYLLVAPGPATPDAPREPLAALDALLAQGKRVHVVLLDEQPEPAAREFTAQAWARLCPDTPVPRLPSTILDNSVATIVANLGGVDWRAPTGYTGYVSGPTGAYPEAYAAQPALPIEARGATFFAAAWPSTLEPTPGAWIIVGVKCEGPEGSVTVLADSTVAVNLAASTAPEALDLAMAIIEDAAPDPQAAVVVVDEAFYSGAAEGGDVALILRLHPSVLVLALAQVYRGVEAGVVEAFVERNIYWLLVLAAGLALVSATWTATGMSSRKSSGGRAPHRTRGRSRISGSWREAVEACSRAREAARLAPEAGPGPVREHARLHESRLRLVCSLVRYAPPPLRWAPVWGWAAERARREALALLLLTGVVSPEEAEALVGGGSGQG